MGVRKAPPFALFFLQLNVFAETVLPRRLVSAGDPGFTVFVGGLPRGALSDVPGLIGCVRGIRVGDQALPMAETAQTFPGVFL